MKQLTVVSLVSIMALAYGCQADSPVDPGDVITPFQRSARNLEHLRSRDNVNTCFTVVRIGGSQRTYQYSSVRLNLPTGSDSRVRVSYVRRTKAGTITRVANCLLSDVRWVGHPKATFGLRVPRFASSGAESSQASDDEFCYWDGQVYVCEEIDATVCQNPDTFYDAATDSCVCSNGSTATDCSLDGSGGGDDDDGQDDDQCEDPGFCDGGGGSSGGGDDPCLDCNPDDYDLTCPTTVQRGSTVACTVMTTVDPDDVSWHFFGGGHEVSGLPGENGVSWSGPAVLGGSVTATVEMSNGGILDLSSEFDVHDRSWGWGTSDWHYSVGGLPDHLHQWKNEGEAVGHICPTVGCHAHKIQPIMQNGVTIAPPVGDGPNRGWVYIADATYGIDEASYINRAYHSGATPQFPLTSQDAAVCAAVQGPTMPNWWDYNVICRGISDLVLIDLFEAVWQHEARHFELKVEAASMPANDIHSAVESLVAYGSPQLLHPLIAQRFTDINEAIASHSADDNADIGASFQVWSRGGGQSFTFDTWTF